MKLIFLLVPFLILNFSCVKSTDDKKTIKNNIAEASGCSTVPHTKDFVKKLHGGCFKKEPQTCKNCHGQNLAESNKSKVSCAKCHKVFDHNESFLKKDHGSNYLKDSNACNFCHKVDSKKDDVQKAVCLNCHNFPHFKKWSSPENHAAKMKTEEADKMKITCFKCHAEASTLKERFPDKFIGCNSCHLAVPHSDDFKESSHGGTYLKDGNACIKCHKVGSLEMDDKVVCWNCHSFPHPKKWALQKNHGKKIKTELENDDLQIVCLDCHAKDSSLRKRFPKKYVGCDSCHIEIPHVEDFYDEEIHGVVGKTYAGGCTNCHTDYTANMPEFESCYACHEEDEIPVVKWVKKNADEEDAEKKAKKEDRKKTKKKNKKRIPSSLKPKTLLEKLKQFYNKRKK